MSPLREVGRQEVLWLLGSLSGLYRLPLSAAVKGSETHGTTLSRNHCCV